MTGLSKKRLRVIVLIAWFAGSGILPGVSAFSGSSGHGHDLRGDSGVRRACRMRQPVVGRVSGGEPFAGCLRIANAGPVRLQPARLSAPYCPYRQQQTRSGRCVSISNSGVALSCIGKHGSANSQSQNNEDMSGQDAWGDMISKEKVIEELETARLVHSSAHFNGHGTKS